MVRRPTRRPADAAADRRGLAPRRLARLALLVAVAVALPTCAGRSPGPGEPARRNAAEAPPPFARAPEFSLLDGHARNHTIDSLMGPNGLVLVLYRGHW